MTRLTYPQAMEFLESVFVTEPDEVTDTHVEAFIMGASMDDGLVDLDQFCASYGIELEDDAVRLSPDVIEAMDIPATKIVIKTRAE